MQSRTHVVAFVLALVVAALATPVVRWVAHRLALYDAPTSRKIHATPTPRLGGIAIALGFFAPLIGLLAYNNALAVLFTAEPMQTLGLFVGGAAILAVGIWDDVRGMRATRKLVLQVAVAVLMFSFGYSVDRLSIPLLGTWELGPITNAVLTVAWFVALMNAVNLIDGLDGLAGGVAFFALVSMYVIASVDALPNLLTTLYAAALAGAVLGFLFYNFNPATIFMGDCGSLFLGLMLAAVSLQTQAKSSTAIALTATALALGLPILDTLLTVVRRVKRGRSVFSADREHLHHRLLAIGLSPRQVALVLYGMCGVFGGLAVWVKVDGTDNTRVAAITVALVVVLAVLHRFFRFRERAFQQQLALSLPDGFALPDNARAQLRGLTSQIREQASTDAAWSAVRQAADLLHLRHVELKLYLRHDPLKRVRQTYSYHRDEPHSTQLPHEEVVVPLEGVAHWYGDLHATFWNAGDENDQGRRLLLHLLGESLAEHIEEHVLDQHRDRFVVSRFPGRKARP
jgi:UDP-GlcNAc:undecaprenyl-phosphate GlcNAc-1-phosphate transferase